MNAAQDFGRLVDIEPRQAWAHEAHAFTPWLAENLDRLSDAIGVPLELTGREVNVGRYSADILATNPQDGSVVLIENQLEWSDHKHLGQIMTYLAGLEAQVMVWLAPNFSEEHLSALHWLNQHTDERFSFFAVKLRVVQIGDSALAPLFDVLEKPNSWDKSLQKTARAATTVPSERTEFLRAFWRRYEELFPVAANDAGAGRGVARWRTIGTGDEAVVVSRYVAGEHVGLFLRGGRGRDGATLLPRIEPVREAMEQAIGMPIANPAYPFTKVGPEFTGPDDWDHAIRWLETETARYADAVRDLLVTSA